MDSEELRKYLDIINKNSEEVLTEGMLQKLAGLALGTVLALGPQVGEAGTVFSYMPKDGVTMKMTRSQDRIPADAKVVFSIDTVTDEVTVVKGGVKNQEIKPDPAAVKQAQQGKTEPSKTKPETSQQKLEPGVVFENKDWIAKYNKDAMSDKPSCTVFSKDNRYIQVNVEADGSGTIYSVLKGRGGVQSYKYRFDSDPAKSAYPSRVDKEIGVAPVKLEDAKGHQKLVIQTFTVLNEIVTDTINLQTLEPAVSKCMQAMNQNDTPKGK